MISVMRSVIASIDTRIDGFLLGDRNKLPGGVCDLLHCRGLCVFDGVLLLPIRIRVIGIEGVIRGYREHLSQMMDSVADSFSEGFLVVLSGHGFVAVKLYLVGGECFDFVSFVYKKQI